MTTRIGTPSPFRAVRRSALRSRKLAHLSDLAERVYWRLLIACDSYGTAGAELWDLSLELAPGVVSLTPERIGEGLDELAAARLVVRWLTGGDQSEPGECWVHVVGFDKHQPDRFKATRGARKSPVPPSVDQMATGSPPGEHPKNSRIEEGVRGSSSPPFPTVVASAPAGAREAVQPSPAGPAPETVKRKRATVARLSDDDVADAVDLARLTLGDLAAGVDDLAAIMAAENSTGRVSLAKVHRLLWGPLAAMLDDPPADTVAGVWREAVRYGLDAARSNEAPNKTYVKKAALGFLTRPRPEGTGPDARPVRTRARNAHAAQYDDLG